MLFVFYFIYGSWFGYYLKNLCLIQGHKDFSFVVFVQKFYNLSFTFRSEVHFELICMYSMRCGWKFIILHINIHLLTIHWKNCIFSIKLLLHCGKKKIIVHVCVYLFLNFLFCSIELFLSIELLSLSLSVVIQRP